MSTAHFKDRRKPWQKQLKTLKIAKCGAMLQENARKFYRYDKPLYMRSSNPVDSSVRAYAESLGISPEEACEKMNAHWRIQHGV